MVFTQCSILNRDNPEVDVNRSPFVRQRTERIEIHSRREHPFGGFSTDLHYLGLQCKHCFEQLAVICCHC